MNPGPSDPAQPSEGNKTSRGGLVRLENWSWSIPSFFLFGALYWRASHFWGSEGYYYLSWLVPPLVVFFFWQRLKSAPSPETPLQGGFFLGLCLGAAALFTGFLGQTMPFWRPLLFLQAIFTVAAAATLTGAVGGGRWMRHFLPIFLVALIALPWPARLEADVVYRLTRTVTAMTEGMLNLLGFAASSVGNRVEVQDQVVEVGDACSGLRSFQGLLMIGVVVGELYRLRWSRIVLVVAAFLISFPLNVLRAVALSVIVVNDGHDAYEKWHDPMGGIVYAVGCLLLLGLSKLLTSDDLKTRRLEEDGVRAAPVALCRAAGAAAMLLVCLSLAGEGWFRLRGGEPAVSAAWSLDFEHPPSGLGTINRVPLEESVMTTLGADRGTHHEMIRGDGARFDLFDFAYDGGIMGMMAAEYHTPEVCMGKYGGLDLVERKPDLVWATAGRKVAVTGYAFRSASGQMLHAFQGVWIAGDDPDGVNRYRDLVRRSEGALVRLKTTFRRLWSGQRSFDVQVFLVSTADVSGLDEGWEACQELLSKVQNISLP